MSDNEQPQREAGEENAGLSSSSDVPHALQESSSVVTQQVPEELQKILDVEMARIDAQNRRTALFERVVDVQNAADQRQYDYHVKVLEAQQENDRESRKIGIRLLTSLIVGGFSLMGILLAVAFWGSDANREMAIVFIKAAFTGLGGYGVLKVIEHGIRRFLR